MNFLKDFCIYTGAIIWIVFLIVLFCCFITYLKNRFLELVNTQIRNLSTANDSLKNELKRQIRINEKLEKELKEKQ